VGDTTGWVRVKVNQAASTFANGSIEVALVDLQKIRAGSIGGSRALKVRWIPTIASDAESRDPMVKAKAAIVMSPAQNMSLRLGRQKGTKGLKASWAPRHHGHILSFRGSIDTNYQPGRRAEVREAEEAFCVTTVQMFW